VGHVKRRKCPGAAHEDFLLGIGPRVREDDVES